MQSNSKKEDKQIEVERALKNNLKKRKAFQKKNQHNKKNKK
jgi:hypothetical protein